MGRALGPGPPGVTLELNALSLPVSQVVHPSLPGERCGQLQESGKLVL